MKNLAKYFLATTCLMSTLATALAAPAATCTFNFPVALPKTCQSGGDVGRGSLRNNNVIPPKAPGTRFFFVAFDSGQFDARVTALNAQGGTAGVENCNKVDTTVANGGDSGSCTTQIFPTFVRIVVS